MGSCRRRDARPAMRARLSLTRAVLCVPDASLIHMRCLVRTNIDIDETLMAEARKASGLATKKATVEEGLRLLVRLKQQEEILRLAGKVTWRGDLDRSRTGRNVR